MANKAISELPQAQNVNNQDLFVLEQSGIAKKLTAETFITEQGIIDALAAALDGHGGISSVTLASVSGRIRTYRITFSDGSATTFQVYDGTSIDRISRTSSSGLDDVYTVFLSDGTTTFFTVHNGADGTVSEAMLNDALKNKAPAVTETTESSAIANFTDGADDMPLHNILAEINPVQDLNGYDAPWPSGGKNQLIFKTISGNIESNGRIVSTQDFYLVVAEVTANQTYVYSVNGVAVASGGIVAAYYSSEPDINSISYDGQRITTGQNPFIAPITGYVAIRATSGSGAQRQIESGSTPTPYYPYSNICPITGHMEANVTRTGANLWDEEWEVGSFNPSTGLPVSASETIRSKNFCPCVGGASYYVKCANYTDIYALCVYWYDADKTYISRVWAGAQTATAPANARYFKIVTNSSGTVYGTTYNHDISINYPSSDHDYHAYQSDTVTLSWQTEAGTVYGGTIDVVSGKLVVDRAYGTLDGSESWSGSSAEWYTDKHDMLRMVNYTNMIKCDTLQTVERASVSQADFHITGYGASSSYIGQNWIYVRLDPSITTASQVQAWFREHPTHYVYPLATPQTYQLTLTGQQLMTLLGMNNVWTDTGNVSVTYPADTKMFIEKLTMPTEDDLVANQAIASGTFFMVGPKLYLSIASIASGAQIIEGTNARQLSLADALNTLSS